MKNIEKIKKEAFNSVKRIDPSSEVYKRLERERLANETLRREKEEREKERRREVVSTIIESGKLKNFLKDLSELSKKYKLYIGGCGCCGSPYIYTISPGVIYTKDYLEFDEEKGIYTTD